MRNTQISIIDGFVRPMYNAKQKILDNYILGIELMGVARPVYRELSVPSDIYLDYLCEILAMTMGWAGHHLTQIEVGDLMYCSKADMEMYDEESVANMRDYSLFTLRDVVKRKGATFTFVYDFGDDWKHEVVLLDKSKYEGYEANNPSVEVLGGEGCCPPDDCGGVDGYAEMLRMLRSEDEEERESMENWLRIWGIEEYDEDEFDLRYIKSRVDDYQRTLQGARMGLYGK